MRSDEQPTLFYVWSDFDEFYCATLNNEINAVKARALEARTEGREDFAVSLEKWAGTLLSWKEKRETHRPK